MKLSIQYEADGIVFQILNGGQPETFPLDHTLNDSSDTIGWEQMNIAEGLWYDGLLTYQSDRGTYLLPAALCVQLEQEIKQGLHLPPENVQLGVFEKGNLGSSSYEIKWAPMIGGKPVGRAVRKGAVVQYGGHSSMLTAAQFRMTKAIDEYLEPGSIEGRARHHAKISKLAEQAGAQVDRFMQKREFLFEDHVDYRIQSDDPRSVQIRPDLPDLPDAVRQNLPSTLSGAMRYRDRGRVQTIFPSNKVKEEYNRIAAIPPITGQSVPEFLENPLAYIPEDIQFDADLFSRRVRGLKIKRTSATPFVHVTPDPNKPGWLQVSTGFSLNSENPDDETGDTAFLETEELKQLMQAAAEHGEKYVFYQDQWIKVNGENVRKFQAAEQEFAEKFGNSIPENQCRYILDIYDNLDRVEYDEALLAYKAINLKTIYEYSVPDCFAGQLKTYQAEGYGFLRAHYETNTGVLLADDMGLGKTVQIIAFLSYLFSQNNLATALLVMPKSLLDNWYSEFQKFLPAEKKIYIHQGVNRYKNSEIITQYDIVMTTYETLARDQTMLAKIQWTCVICDEVQRIKNFQTLAASAVKGMNTKCRIAMTGTPVENHLGELWSIADFAQPGLLGSYQSFRKQYELPLGNVHGQDPHLASSLIETISPIFLRRTKDILVDQLPPKYEHTVPLELDRAGAGLYQSIVADYQNSDENGMILATIQQLLMLCSHPKLIAGGEACSWDTEQLIEESPKLQWTVKKLTEIFSANEKVILFTKFKRMQSILRLVILKKFGIDSKIINGELTGNRLEVIHQFSATPGSGAIILSPRAAGVGLTITAANHVIHYSREWNPAVENQATDRAYRIGQTKPVHVYYPVLRTESFVTADERLDELLRGKRELMKNVIIPADMNIKISEFENILKC